MMNHLRGKQSDRDLSRSMGYRGGRLRYSVS